MVTGTFTRRQKASLHISIDAGLSHRLRRVAAVMSIPLSHLTSLAISRAVRQFESELGLSEPEKPESEGASC
jgi:post-segregation antitoxin (ccd killing protein)